jgi:adenylylsulfate kinase-like enzyme
MDNQRGFTVWFTGLPCSGKKTLAALLAQGLRERGLSRIEVLTSADVREHVSSDPNLGGESSDADTGYLAFVCKVLSRNDVVAVAAAVSPSRKLREHARKLVGRFVEVFVDCPVGTCIERDRAGRYQEALSGAMRNFIGVSAPYEPPTDPEVVCKTSEEPPEASVQKIIASLERLQYVCPDAAGYSADEEERVRGRLEGLGYL